MLNTLSDLHNQVDLENFIPYVHRKIYGSRKPEKITSCVDNLNAIGVIFSGFKNMEIIATRFSPRNPLPITLSYRNWLGREMQLTYRVQDLMTRHIQGHVSKILSGERGIEERVPRSDVRNSPEIVGYTKEVQNIVTRMGRTSKRTIYKYLERGYDFNRETILELQKKIDEHAQELIDQSDPDIGYVYYMIIKHNDRNPKLVDHAFVLEQFYHAELEEVHFRIYQGCLNKFTFMDDVRARGYKEDGSGSWNVQELKQFLITLNSLISDANLKKQRRDARYQAFFRVPAPLKGGNQFHRKDKLLTGTRLQYISHRFDSKNFLVNIRRFATSYMPFPHLKWLNKEPNQKLNTLKEHVEWGKIHNKSYSEPKADGAEIVAVIPSNYKFSTGQLFISSYSSCTSSARFSPNLSSYASGQAGIQPLQ